VQSSAATTGHDVIQRRIEPVLVGVLWIDSDDSRSFVIVSGLVFLCAIAGRCRARRR
jgi:hypothetical protein